MHFHPIVDRKGVSLNSKWSDKISFMELQRHLLKTIVLHWINWESSWVVNGSDSIKVHCEKAQPRTRKGASLNSKWSDEISTTDPKSNISLTLKVHGTNMTQLTKKLDVINISHLNEVYNGRLSRSVRRFKVSLMISYMLLKQFNPTKSDAKIISRAIPYDLFVIFRILGPESMDRGKFTWYHSKPSVTRSQNQQECLPYLGQSKLEYNIWNGL